MQSRVEEHQEQRRGLYIAFVNALRKLDREDHSRSKAFVEFAAFANTTTKTSVRLFDIFRWIAQPKYLANTIAQLSLYHHQEAVLKFDREQRRQAVDGIRYELEMEHDEEHAVSAN